jgi:DNA mismatch repair protein MutS2
MGGCPETDLHGLDVVDAETRIDRFLAEAHAQEYAVVKIIHGRGTGRLQEATRRLLDRHPLVAYARGSHNPNEQGGVIYAVMAKAL